MSQSKKQFFKDTLNENLNLPTIMTTGLYTIVFGLDLDLKTIPMIFGNFLLRKQLNKGHRT